MAEFIVVVVTCALYYYSKIKCLRVSIGAISAADVLVRDFMWASYTVRGCGSPAPPSTIIVVRIYML